MLFVPIMTTAGGFLNREVVLGVILLHHKKEVHIDRRARRKPYTVASCILCSDEASITMIRESYPKSMMRELKRLGISFVRYDSGIYYSQNFFIPAQIVVTQGDKADVQAVLKVSGTANYDLYEKIRSESNMKSFWDEIKNEGFNEGRSQGISQGRAEALEQTAVTLFDMGMAVDKIAQAVHTSVNIVEEWLSVRK